jgi:F-type H+-transporting ATPase subunit a
VADVTSLLASTAVEGGCHLGGSNGCGFPAPGVEIFEFAPIWSFQIAGITFDINKPVILILLCSFVLIVFFAIAFAKPRLVPGKVQSLGEMSYLFVRDQIGRETIGKAGDKYLPFLFALFFYVLILNVMGIFPGAQLPPTAYFVYPVTLAIIVWMTYMFLGVKNQGGIKFFTNMMFPPGVPVWVLVLLGPVEFLSNVLIRPFTLAIRLFANMFAGHLLLTVFIVGALYLASPSVIGILGTVGSGLMTLIMTAFEFMIEVLQAYIFTLLTASYIAGSIANEH